MKKHIVLSIIISVVLTMALLLTSCGKTTGGGTFTSPSNLDEELHNVSFSIQAQASGEPNEDPVGEQLGENSLNLQYVFFQPARGNATFIDRSGQVTIVCTINGTFALSQPVDVVFPSYPSMFDDANVSVFTGTCNVKSKNPELNGSYYMLVESAEYFGDDPDLSDGIGIEVFEDPIVDEDGILNLDVLDSDPVLAYTSTGGLKGQINVAP